MDVIERALVARAKRLLDRFSLFEIAEEVVEGGSVRTNQPIDQRPALGIERSLPLRSVVQIGLASDGEEFLQRYPLPLLQRTKVRWDWLAGANGRAAQLGVAEIVSEALLDPQRRSSAAVVNQIVNQLVKWSAVAAPARAALHDHRSAAGR